MSVICPLKSHQAGPSPSIFPERLSKWIVRQRAETRIFSRSSSFHFQGFRWLISCQSASLTRCFVIRFLSHSRVTAAKYSQELRHEGPVWFRDFSVPTRNRLCDGISCRRVTSRVHIKVKILFFVSMFSVSTFESQMPKFSGANRKEETFGSGSQVCSMS